MLKSLALAAVTVTLAGSAAQASPTSWDMPSGDNGSYTYSGGMNSTNKIETGTAFSGGFFFVPTDFKAATAGGHDEASDTLSVILNAKPSTSFTRISSNILGDYTIDQVGAVNSTGMLRVTNLDTSMTLSSPLAFGGTVPVLSLSDAGGIFQGGTGIDLPEGWRNIRVEMDGMVSADAMGGSSLIQIKDAELGVSTAEIPIPAAIAVAPVAAAVYGWRNRRKGAAK